MTERPSWDAVYLQMADLVAQRSTCPRLACGAVIVSPEYQVLTTGYNGAPRGERHCTEYGCIIEGGHCVRAVHAELNAILQGARLGVSLHGGVLYVSNRPCIRCAVAITQVGLSRIVIGRPYDTDGLELQVFALFGNAGIDVVWKAANEN